jgi:multicomponent Na+:H+ antiporter subunit D
MVRTAPVVAVLFLVPALSLAGIPPLSGFVAKLALVDAGVASTRYTMVGIAIVVSLLTMFSMLKIWSGVFWSPASEAPENAPRAVGRLGGPVLMVVPTATLVLLGIAIAVAGAPLYEYSVRAASDLLDPSTYVTRVLGG